MTDLERRLLWYEARAALNLRGDYPDWPERLALPFIARLHAPEAFAGMLALLEAEADAGTLPTQTHEFKTSRRGRWKVTSAYLTGRRITTTQPPIIETRRVSSALAADVAGIFDSGQLEPGRLLAGWLAPFRQQTKAHQEEAGPASLTVMKKEDILKRLGSRYPALDSAWKNSAPWIMACRVKHSRYILEKIEEGCRREWPRETAPRSPDDLTLVGLVRGLR